MTRDDLPLTVSVLIMKSTPIVAPCPPGKTPCQTRMISLWCHDGRSTYLSKSTNETRLPYSCIPDQNNLKQELVVLHLVIMVVLFGNLSSSRRWWIKEILLLIIALLMTFCQYCWWILEASSWRPSHRHDVLTWQQEEPRRNEKTIQEGRTWYDAWYASLFLSISS